MQMWLSESHEIVPQERIITAKDDFTYSYPFPFTRYSIFRCRNETFSFVQDKIAVSSKLRSGSRESKDPVSQDIPDMFAIICVLVTVCRWCEFWVQQHAAAAGEVEKASHRHERWSLLFM